MEAEDSDEASLILHKLSRLELQKISEIDAKLAVTFGIFRNQLPGVQDKIKVLPNRAQV